MTFDEKAFLKTSSAINKNQAEYNILSSLKYCDYEIFFLQLFNIQLVKECLKDILNYLSSEYNASELNLFCLDDSKSLTKIKIGKLSNSIEKEDFLINKAQEISSNGTYVLIKSKTIFSLFYNGKFDENFKNYFISKESLQEIQASKYEMKDLKVVFDIYHSNRKHNGSDYIKCNTIGEPKVVDSISEQELRNDLFKFLKDKTNLIEIPEQCTSLMRDEESVDISLVDYNNNVAIIEVKFVIGKDYFLSDSKRNKYKFEDRFSKGYKQLSRYCNHLFEEKLYNVRNAFLYMFYAYSQNEVEIKKKADKIYNDYLMNNVEETKKLKQQYSGTILDNIVDIEN